MQDETYNQILQLKNQLQYLINNQEDLEQIQPINIQTAAKLAEVLAKTYTKTEVEKFFTQLKYDILTIKENTKQKIAKYADYIKKLEIVSAQYKKENIDENKRSIRKIAQHITIINDKLTKNTEPDIKKILMKEYIEIEQLQNKIKDINDEEIKKINLLLTTIKLRYSQIYMQIKTEIPNKETKELIKLAA